MTLLDAVILGIVEGLTEFLPVSSTGHLILTANLLGLEKTTADNFAIAIQLGAILSVLTLYRQRAWEMILGILGRHPGGRELFLKLLLAFAPAVVLGLALDDLIEAYLFHAGPVIAALLLGGVAMIVVERYVKRRHPDEEALRTVEQVTYRDALLIGFAQCLAMWPGTSRSMATIIGARLCGLRATAAAEFSFLLALPTLGGATVFKLVKDREEFLALEGGIPLLLVGNAVAFAVALAAVHYFVRFVSRFGMEPFGYYRIALALLFLGGWVMGWVQL
jgi:undecaprenyl-diphosphatase